MSASKDVIKIELNDKLEDAVKQSGIAIKVDTNKQSEAVLSDFEAFKGKEDGTYIVLEIQASNPDALKDAFKEFLENALETAKGFTDEVENFVGEEQFHVITKDNKVIAAISINAESIPFWEKISNIAKIPFKDPISFTLDAQANKSLRDLKGKKAQDLADLSVYFGLIFSVSDDDKKLVLNNISEFPTIPKLPLGPILSLKKFGLSLGWSPEEVVSDGNELTSGYIDKGLGVVDKAFGKGKEKYSGVKEMLEGFPFVEEFIGALKEHGAGEGSIGGFCNKIAFKFTLTSKNIKALYDELTEE